MKFTSIITGTVIIIMGAFFLFLFWAVVTDRLEHPESELLGTWKEIEWTYEKVDLARGSSSIQKDILRERLKHQITEDLVIHKSETWHFNKDGSLVLKRKDGKEEKLNWRLKGRGHILKLKHKNSSLEFYQIRSLNDDELILHFENDNHARGIVKIIFKKIKES